MAGMVYTPRSNVTLYAKWIKAEEEIENLYLTSDKYKFKMSEIEGEKSYLYRINPDTTLTELKYYLDTNGTITVYSKSGRELGPNDIVTTGMTLVDVGADRTITLILSVKGDTSGKGKVTTTDLSVMKQQLIKEYNFTDERFLSLDISDDGKITATDLAAINQAYLKELDLATID